ncbi:uncharacterized protein BDR25DRAFT_160563, partial [Lindgomyces ingoldianus]
NFEDFDPAKEGNSALPRSALHCLHAWLSANLNHPYPSPEVTRALARKCNLTEKQVNNWFTHARADRVHKLEDSAR